MKGPRYQEWADDQRRDEASARRAGHASVDEWVDCINDVADELEWANAGEEERERIEFERSRKAYDRLFQRAKIYGMAK